MTKHTTNLKPVQSRMTPENYIKYLEDRIQRLIDYNIELDSKLKNYQLVLDKIDSEEYIDLLYK